MTNKYQAKRLYSLTEVAKILGVSRVTVFNKIQNGELKAHKIGNNYAIFGDHQTRNRRKDLANNYSLPFPQIVTTHCSKICFY